VSAADSPAVARRRVRLALREAREAAGFTQTQVAEAMEWSLSKVMRIESGEVSVALNDLKALLAYVKITDPATVAALVDTARTAKQRRTMWWDEPGYREHLTLAMRQTIQYELDAVTIRHYYGQVLPARFQTDDYAKAILGKYTADLSPEEQAVRLEARIRRRDTLIKQRTPPKLLVLLDESILFRQFGGPRVFADQLRYLIKRSENPTLAIRVLPFTADGPTATYGSFEIFDLDESGVDAVMYRETHVTDEIVDDVVDVKRHRLIFEEMWQVALDEAESVQRIRQRCEEVQETINKRA
jgi:transcriptional regulator with XRE-family HTH domain